MYLYAFCLRHGCSSENIAAGVVSEAIKKYESLYLNVNIDLLWKRNDSIYCSGVCTISGPGSRKLSIKLMDGVLYFGAKSMDELWSTCVRDFFKQHLEKSFQPYSTALDFN